MAGLEAKILGEDRGVGYCSSSDEEDEGVTGKGRDPERALGSGSDDEDEDKGRRAEANPAEVGAGALSVGLQGLEGRRWGGVSRNTGPKGVLADHSSYREYEARAQAEADLQFLKLINSTAITTRSEADETKAVLEEKLQKEGELDPLDLELCSDDSYKEFLKERMKNMLQKTVSDLPTFGSFHEIESGEEYLKVLDETNPKVSVVLHIYESGNPECRIMNECLTSLSPQYPRVRFCKILASRAGLSQKFKKLGVPAILVYKGGNLIGNFVQLKEEFGSEFYPGDVENYLIENGILQNKNDIPVLS